MSKVHDAAEYVCDLYRKSTGETFADAFKIHFLLYYAQALSLVRRDRPIFANDIVAEYSSPVIEALQECCGTSSRVKSGFTKCGDASKLSNEDRSAIDDAFNTYGGLTNGRLVVSLVNDGMWEHLADHIRKTDEFYADHPGPDSAIVKGHVIPTDMLCEVYNGVWA